MCNKLPFTPTCNLLSLTLPTNFFYSFPILIPTTYSYRVISLESLPKNFCNKLPFTPPTLLHIMFTQKPHNVNVFITLSLTTYNQCSYTLLIIFKKQTLLRRFQHLLTFMDITDQLKGESLYLEVSDEKLQHKHCDLKTELA